MMTLSTWMDAAAVTVDVDDVELALLSHELFLLVYDALLSHASLGGTSPATAIVAHVVVVVGTAFDMVSVM